MRTPRIRVDHEGCYYHLINRATGTSADRPFGDREKRKLVELVAELSGFYTIEVLAYSYMSNHTHIVAFAPSERPDAETAAARYNAYYTALSANREKAVAAGKAHPQPVKSIRPDSPDIEQVQDRLRDISHFMKDLRQRFTQWYNKRGNRRGTVWADRFKSVVLEGKNGSSAVWSCIKYVELNAVRAHMVEDPAEYRYCSWGVWCGRGKHPYGKNFFFHARRVLGERGAKLTDKQLRAELRADMRRTIVAATEARMEDVIEAYNAAKKEEPLLLRLDRRVRYWSDGAVIGSREFVQSISDQVFGAGKRRRFGKGRTGDGELLFTLRNPRL